MQVTLRCGFAAIWMRRVIVAPSPPTPPPRRGEGRWTERTHGRDGRKVGAFRYAYMTPPSPLTQRVPGEGGRGDEGFPGHSASSTSFFASVRRILPAALLGRSATMWNCFG